MTKPRLSTIPHIPHTPTGNPMFKEKLTMHGDNRRYAADLEIQPAIIADGTEGVMVRHGKRIMVFTRDEAQTLVEGITEVIEP